MGTNYYAKIRADKKKEKELIELITNGNTADYDKIVELTNELYGEAVFVNSKGCLVGSVIHIGKKSRGWKFLWEHHLYVVKNGHVEEEETQPGHSVLKYVEEPDTLYSLYGKLTKENIRKFIMREDIDIYDEYGELLDKNEFLEIAFSQDGLDSITARKEMSEKERRRPVYQADEWLEPINMAGYKVRKNATDFSPNNGLRFAIFRDFR